LGSNQRPSPPVQLLFKVLLIVRRDISV